VAHGHDAVAPHTADAPIASIAMQSRNRNLARYVTASTRHSADAPLEALENVEITVRNRLLAAVAGAAAIGCVVGPLPAQAVTTGTGTDTLTVTGGSLAVASVGSATFTVTLGSGTVTTAATNLNAGTYTDTTGSGAGWNGTLALQQFVDTQPWVAIGTALASNASAAYTATSADAFYSVAVTANAATTVNVTWAGTESGSGTATKGSAFAIGTHGLTITFATGITYLVTDTYSIKADVLSTTALTMAAGGSCVVLLCWVAPNGTDVGLLGTITIAAGDLQSYNFTTDPPRNRQMPYLYDANDPIWPPVLLTRCNSALDGFGNLLDSMTFGAREVYFEPNGDLLAVVKTTSGASDLRITLET